MDDPTEQGIAVLSLSGMFICLAMHMFTWTVVCFLKKIFKVSLCSMCQRFEASVSVWAVGSELFQPLGWDRLGFLGGGRQAKGVRVQLRSSCGDYIGYQQPADGHLHHPLTKNYCGTFHPLALSPMAFVVGLA